MNDNKSNPHSNNQIVEMVCKEFGLDYSVLGEIYARKILWHKFLQNEVDYIGIAQRICKDVSNILLGTPVHIFTTNRNVNEVIKSELYGRLKLNEMLPKHLSHMLGLGDGLLTVYRDAIDDKPALNYVPIYNVIPITYNNHNISELVWFSTNKIDDNVYITCVVERLTGRETRLYKADNGSLTQIDNGTPKWNQILSNTTPVINYLTQENSAKFAWFSTGLFNVRWLDTPFSNGFIWPVSLISQIEKDYKLLNEEYKNSAKRIFVSPELCKTEIRMVNNQGSQQLVKSFDSNSTLFESIDVGEEQIKEWNPQVRFKEYEAKMVFDLQLLGQQIGLGSEFYNINTPKIEMTATQVILSHRDAFNTINVIKQNLVSVVRALVNGLIDLWIEDGLLSEEDRLPSLFDIGVVLDDGVLINKGAKVAEGLNIVDRGLIDQMTFLTNYCYYTEGQAIEIVERKKQEDLEKAQMQMQIQLQMSAITQQTMGNENSEKKEKKNGVK